MPVFIAGEGASILLDSVDGAFGEVAFAVAKSVIVMRLLAIAATRGDDSGETQSLDHKSGRKRCVHVDVAGSKQSKNRSSAVDR